MLCLIFLQMVTTYLVTFLSENIKPYNLYDIKEFGRIAFQRPLPPQLYLPISADFPDNYFPSNLVIKYPSLLLLNTTHPVDHLGFTNGLFSRISFPQLLNVVQGVAKIASRVFATTVETIIATLLVLDAIEPLAAAAYVLREQRGQDWLDLENESLPSFVPFWGLISIIKHQHMSIAALRAQLKRSGFARLRHLQEVLTAEVKSVMKMLLTQQESSNCREIMTQEDEAQRQNQGVLVQTIQDLRTQDKTSKEVILQLEDTVKRQDERIQQVEKSLRAEQEDSCAEVARFKAQIAGCEDKLKATIEESNERFDKAQHTANERICDLQEKLDAQKLSGWEATKKLEAELKVARGQIQDLQSAIQISSHEPHNYHETTKSLTQPKRSLHHLDHSAPILFRPPPTQLGIQFLRGQSLFAARLRQIPASK
ncbi:hypothetical protein MMC07_004739 [Pseudocyphellaria aurata]|nr:hypothetical protein [Pseudocyphellaria aurata]